MTHRLKSLIFLGMVLLVTACGPSGPEDYRQQGQKISLALIHELSKVHTRDELVTQTPRLTELFDALVEVMISARQQGYEEMWSSPADLEPSEEQNSRKLRLELERVCRLEGGAELISQCQHAALYRLDAHEKQLAAKRF